MLWRRALPSLRARCRACTADAGGRQFRIAELVSADVAASFEQRGFAVVEQLVSPAVVEALRARFEVLFDGQFETGTYPDEWHWRSGISVPHATREICNGWKSDRVVASVALSASLGRLASNLMGWPGARIGQDDVLWKPPGGTPVGFHQDSSYISTQFEPYDGNSLTIWIALDDADPEVGTVEYAPGSHRWAVDHRRVVDDLADESFHDQGGSGGDHRAAMRRCPEATALLAPADADIVACTVAAGGAVLHHQDTWHGSGPNTSETRPRRALGVHLIRSDVRFRAGDALLGEAGAPSYIYGRYKRMGETSLDESHFPITWAAADSGQQRSAFLDNYCTLPV